ncbi:hypothetical protein PHMEG_0009594 [Phytophthora megakarya]|uniref:Uncharacterized protein n=1 Tax=Phytophthora megakarya TaxID=4795 RepID=A0A225WFU0_9STRA|nr:hypothetical protein PHMEG_0009594 [Phytophthora megakarya]
MIQSEKKRNLSLDTATQSQKLLEDDLLREETRISTSHYKHGFVRERTQTGSGFSIDRVARESLSNIIRTANINLEEAMRDLFAVKPGWTADQTRHLKLRDYAATPILIYYFQLKNMGLK